MQRVKYTGRYSSVLTGVETYLYTFILIEDEEDGTYKGTLKVYFSEDPIDDKNVKIGDYVRFEIEPAQEGQKPLIVAISPE